MFQYGDKRPVFDVLSPEGTDLSPIMSAIYLFLTMIIVFQVRNAEKLKRNKSTDKDINKTHSITEVETFYPAAHKLCCKSKPWLSSYQLRRMCNL